MTPKDAKPPDNFDRLRQHLKDDSLAAKLAQAHHAAQPANRAQSIAAVLEQRLNEVRNSIENPKT